MFLEGCAGVSPGWCEGIIVGHFDSCVLIQFRVDNASREKLCDELEEWPLSTFWDGVLHEKRGRIYHIRQYPIEEVLLAFDLWNAEDESCALTPISSSLWRADSEGCRARPDPRLYLGRRVAKFFAGKIFLGTVIGCRKGDLWKIYYDDGDEEEYNLADLIRYLKLYTRLVVVDSESPTCDTICLSGSTYGPVDKTGGLPNPDRQTLKKVLNAFIDVELSMHNDVVSVAAIEELATESVIVDALKVPSGNPIHDSVGSEYNVVNDVEGSAEHQDDAVDIDSCSTSEICSKEVESMDRTPQSESVDGTMYTLGYPPPDASEHALCKMQSKWADFPIGCPVLFKEMLKATVECVYFNFRDNVYRYGIQLSRGGSRLQVRGTDLSVSSNTLVRNGSESSEIGGPTIGINDGSSVMQSTRFRQESDVLGAGRIANALDTRLACSDTNHQLFTAKQSVSMSTRFCLPEAGAPALVSPLEPMNREKRRAVAISTASILSIPDFESKKHKVDPEYKPRVRKESRGFAVETPALRRVVRGKRWRNMKFGQRPWLKCRIHARSPQTSH